MRPWHLEGRRLGFLPLPLAPGLRCELGQVSSSLRVPGNGGNQPTSVGEWIEEHIGAEAWQAVQWELKVK